MGGNIRVALDKPSGTWTKIAIAIAGLVLGWLCYSIQRRSDGA
jgi:hypothetical protein